jgi:hypothetical protein
MDHLEIEVQEREACHMLDPSAARRTAERGNDVKPGCRRHGEIEPPERLIERHDMMKPEEQDALRKITGDVALLKALVVDA